MRYHVLVLHLLYYTYTAMLRGIVVHSYYVDVMTTTTMYVGAITGTTLHSIISSTTTVWDAGGTVVYIVGASSYAWYKDNHQDSYGGVDTLLNMVCTVVSISLVVVSEVSLFISILWSVVLTLVADTIHTLVV